MDFKPCSCSVMKTGDIIGRYTVLGIYQRVDHYDKYAHVRCSCGSKDRFVRIATLRSGQSRSCGCLHKQIVTKHGVWKHPLFKIWRAMMRRCYKPNDRGYKRYGARGIKVCDRWHNVNQFIADMSQNYKHGLTLDRINNSGDYEPSNCRWTSHKIQNRNYSRNVILDFNGESLCLMDWSEKLNINYYTLWDRLKRGWPVEKTLTTPVIVINQ